MKLASSRFRLLGDEARLRLLRVLGKERLNVGELTLVLGLAQSGVSRHLGLLKDEGLIAEDRDAGYTFYRLAPSLASGDDPLRTILQAEFARSASDPIVAEDDARLQEVYRHRKESFKEGAGPDTRESKQLVPGRSWAAWSRAIGMLLPPLHVADLGCGEGYLTIEAAAWASKVTAVDRSGDVLNRAKALARRRRVTNVIWRRGELERLPLADASVDVSMLSQALHHAREPQQALNEAVRVTVPGGRVLVLDLRAHKEEWVRTKLGDETLGFTDDELGQMMATAGLRQVRVRVGARQAGDPFTVLVAVGTIPAADGRTPTRKAR